MPEHLATVTVHPTGDTQCDECGRIVVMPHYHLGEKGTHWNKELQKFVENEPDVYDSRAFEQKTNS